LAGWSNSFYILYFTHFC